MLGRSAVGGYALITACQIALLPAYIDDCQRESKPLIADRDAHRLIERLATLERSIYAAIRDNDIEVKVILPATHHLFHVELSAQR